MAAKGGPIDFMFLAPPLLPGRWIGCWKHCQSNGQNRFYYSHQFDLKSWTSKWQSKIQVKAYFPCKEEKDQCTMSSFRQTKSDHSRGLCIILVTITRAGPPSLIEFHSIDNNMFKGCEPGHTWSILLKTSDALFARNEVYPNILARNSHRNCFKLDDWICHSFSVKFSQKFYIVTHTTILVRISMEISGWNIRLNFGMYEEGFNT